LNFSQDVLVGDLALLEPGEIIPCDGVLVAGHNIRCDESGATGESDAIKKVTPEEALEDWKVNKETKKDPFIISGSKVLEGVGQYVVIAVGQKSFNGRIMMGKPLVQKLTLKTADPGSQLLLVIPKTLPFNSSSTTSPSSLRRSVALVVLFSLGP
jgi:magnesium-transporting ATPase (P-type)